MGFIDTAIITVISGRGGNTIVRRGGYKGKIKFKRKIDISYGGNGGDVWLVTDKGINTLNHFFLNKKFFAENGQHGRRYGCRGRNGKSLFIRVPVGTRVYDQNTYSIVSDLMHDQEKLMLVKGGSRGLLNSRAFCDQHRFPFSEVDRDHIQMVELGGVGEKLSVRLELLLLADVGVLGFPNTGKSTFLRCISSAKPKIGDYPFTTLVPNLGVVYIGNESFIVADIPGIIKGASLGLGLGFSFLKHLERCRMLLHFIEFFQIENFEIIENILVIINELKSYSVELSMKPVWLVFNKIDLLDLDQAKKKVNDIVYYLKWKERYYLISSKYNYGVNKLCHDVMKFIKCN